MVGKPTVKDAKRPTVGLRPFPYDPFPSLNIAYRSDILIKFPFPLNLAYQFG